MTKRKAIFIIVTLVVSLAAGTTVLASGGGDRPAPKGPVLAESEREHLERPSTTASTTQAGDDPTNVESPATPAEGSRDADDHDAPLGDPVHEVLPGAGGPPPAGVTDPIGDLDDDRPVPAAFDFMAEPHQQYETNGYGAATDLAVAPSCSHQCITKGVAYARGFGAELVVETSLPVQLFITAIADPDDDGDYEELYVESTPFGVTSHSWGLDHLVPGETYYVMAAATDEDGHTAYAWGEFTTLSHRSVYVELGSASVYGGPGGITSNTWWLGLDGPIVKVTPGDQGILLYNDLPRYADISFWMLRGWDDDLCESAADWDDSTPKQGHWNEACFAWNSTFLDDVDLDVAPAGQTRWTQSSVQLSLHPPTGAGDGLPPGYGDPYYFHFEVPMTLHVTYS